MFNENIQDKIEDFINKRFERDKKIVIERTSDISRLVLLMEEYLNEYLPTEFDIIIHDGTYAEVQSKNTDCIYALHASGNGDFRSHKVVFEFIR